MKLAGNRQLGAAALQQGLAFLAISGKSIVFSSLSARTLQVFPDTLDPDAGFVHAPAAAHWALVPVPVQRTLEQGQKQMSIGRWRDDQHAGPETVKNSL